MNVTEFQPRKGGGVVTDAIDSGDKLIALIKQVVSVDGLELSQIRLAEILIKIIQLAGLGTTTTPISPVPITVSIGFEPASNTVTVAVNGISSSIALTETHASFTGTTIANNSTNKVALQALETALELLPNGAESGLYMLNRKVRLGTNPLQENVAIDGLSLRSLNLKDLTTFLANTVSIGGTARMYMGLTTAIGVPAYIKAEVSATPTIFGLLNVDPDGELTQLTNTNGTDKAGVYATNALDTKLASVSGGIELSFAIENRKHVLKNIATKTSQTKIVWIDDTTGEIVKGDAPAGGGGGSGYVEYDATDGVRVWASDVGVTADWVSGELTVTIPVGVHLQAFRVALANGSNVQAGADGGGASNWIRVKITGTSGYNTTASDMKIPSIQKCLYAAGAPGLSNAYSIDIDNNPNMAVVGVGTNSITIRIWNLIVPNGAQFTFNGI